MGYRVVDPDGEPDSDDRPCDLRRLTASAGLSNVAVNRYRATPGQQLPLAYHYHDEQEEAFFVVSGTMHVETPERTYEVPAGSLFAADPDSPHRAYNAEDADGDLTVLAVGAPQTEGDAHAYDPEEP